MRFLKATGRKAPRIALVEKYAKAQGMFHTAKSEEPVFTDTLHLDLSDVEPSLAGPRRPQDRVSLSKVGEEFATALMDVFKKEDDAMKRVKIEGTELTIGHGDVVIAAITSCTNTSNPYVMLGAGLLAKKAVARGLKVRPWVKTSLAPGSQVVTDYLARAGLDKSLNKLGFNLVGYGCTTCIGNSDRCPNRWRTRLPKAIWSPPRSFPATAISRAACIRRCARTTSPRPCWSWPMRSPGNVNGDLTKEPIGYDRTMSRSISTRSGRARRRSRTRCANR